MTVLQAACSKLFVINCLSGKLCKAACTETSIIVHESLALRHAVWRAGLHSQAGVAAGKGRRL